MDKITISSLGAIPENEIVYLQIGEATIKVKKTLSYNEILNLIQWTVNLVVDDRPFIAAPMAEIAENIAIVKFFTNLDVSLFDEPAFNIEEGYNMYGIIAALDGFNKVKRMVDSNQLEFIHKNIWKTAESIIAYRNSAAGILEQLSFQAQTTSTNIEEIIEKSGEVTNAENIQKLMEVVSKLGPTSK